VLYGVYILRWKEGGMKCSKCGADMKGKDFCNACGAPSESLAERMEVAYKVFKKSELLEIGRKKDEDAQKEAMKTRRAKAVAKAASAKSPVLPGKGKPAVIIGVLLLAAVIGCAFFLWRFLFSQ